METFFLPVVIMANFAIAPNFDVWIYPKQFKSGEECVEFARANQNELFHQATIAYEFKVPPQTLLCFSNDKLKDMDIKPNLYSTDTQAKKEDTAI